MNRNQILSALRERILAFATSRVSRDHAEDLTQDTMAVLHEKYPLVSELTELVPLAFQVLRYKMLDAHRKALRQGQSSLGQLQESVTTDEASGSHEQTTYVVNQDRSVPELLVRILIGKP